MERKYKICWIADSVDVRGGGVKRMLLWLQHLDRARFHVTFLFASNNPSEIYGGKFQGLPNVTLVNLDRMKSKRHLFVPAIYQLCRWARTNQDDFDLVHLLSHLSDILVIPAFLLAGRRYKYISMTGGPKFPLESRLKRSVFRFLHGFVKAHVNLYLTVSEHDRQELIQYYHVPEEKVLVHRIGVDSGAFCESERSNRHDREKIRFGFAGRFSPEKGIKCFVDAVEIYCGRNRVDCHEKVLFSLAGDGPIKEEIRAYVQERGLGNMIRLEGWQDEISQFLSEIDVLVVPSFWEGTPRVILEAGLLGVPAIATNVGGIPEIVKNMETGVLIPAGNAEKLYEEMERLVRNRSEIERMGANARRFVTREWGIRESVKRLEEIYTNEIERQSGR